MEYIVRRKFDSKLTTGIVGVIHKATQGTTYVDETYASRRVEALACGLLWGAYHFGVGGAAFGSSTEMRTKGVYGAPSGGKTSGESVNKSTCFTSPLLVELSAMDPTKGTSLPSSGRMRGFPIGRMCRRSRRKDYSCENICGRLVQPLLSILPCGADYPSEKLRRSGCVNNLVLRQ